MQELLRLFVAIYPPLELAREWLSFARESLPKHVRLSREDQVHLTMLFIGDTPERELPEVRESVERSAAGIPGLELRTRRLFMLPERGEPRLLAMETDAASGLLELHRRLVQRFAHPKRKKADDFLPHFTLARFPGLLVERKATSVTPTAFPVGEIRLVRSELRHSGAEHSIDKVFSLQPNG